MARSEFDIEGIEGVTELKAIANYCASLGTSQVAQGASLSRPAGRVHRPCAQAADAQDCAPSREVTFHQGGQGGIQTLGRWGTSIGLGTRAELRIVLGMFFWKSQQNEGFQCQKRANNR